MYHWSTPLHLVRLSSPNSLGWFKLRPFPPIVGGSTPVLLPPRPLICDARTSPFGELATYALFKTRSVNL